MLKSACAVLFLVSVTYADLALPPYIKPCARNDPKFNDCALQHARDAIPEIVKGDRKYKIPPMDPIEITEIKVSHGPKQAGFTLNLMDVKMYGLKDTYLQDINFDLAKRHVQQDMHIKELVIVGQYDISGRVLVLPISGKGDINITLVDCSITFSYDFTLDEDNHVVLTNSETVVEPAQAYLHLTNLFNGDRLLGKEMNSFINENWRDVFKEMAPTVTHAFNEVATTISNNIASAVPYDTIFPEELP